MPCRTYTTLEERFWKRVFKEGKNGPLGQCWEWRGYKDELGRGQLYVGNKKIRRTHLVSWELHHGPVPEGQCVLHLCDNMGCVNPAHMELGSQPQNIAQMIARNRHNPRGMYRPGFTRRLSANKPQRTAEERFWEKINKHGSIPPHATELGECWIWTASTNQCGYGKFTNMVAHKYHWQIIAGRDIPDGMKLMHKCDNPACVRLEHLSVGTHGDNMRDMMNKGRNAQPSGEKHYRTKLTREQVSEIRRLWEEGVHQTKIATMFSRKPNTISKIVNKKRWL